MPLILSGTNGITTSTLYGIAENSNGVVTMPYQAAFHVTAFVYGTNQTFTAEVTLNSTNASGHSIITNIGNNYSATTGRFTAPVAGNYYFAGSFSRSAGNATSQFKVNGGTAYGRSLSYGADWQSTTSFALLSLLANDYVTMEFGATNSTTVSGYNVSFVGQLIG